MVPRRAAAQKAIALSAEHLESSPLSESDAEDTPEHTFGEPSTPKSAVKVTYGGKRKYKPTPPKLRVVTGGESSQTRRRALSLVTSPTRNRLRPSGAVGGRGGGRGCAGRSTRNSNLQMRSTSPTSSIENDSMALSDPEVIIVDEESEPPNVPRRSTVSGSENRPVNSNTTKGKTVNGKGPRKRPLARSCDLSDGESSSLTSLSSPEVQIVPVLTPATSAPPRLARQFLRTQSHFVPNVGFAVKPTPVTQSKSLDNLFAPLDSTDDESCDEVDTGNLVWVCITTEGDLGDCNGKSDDNDVLWWPAKILLPKPLMRVALFGRPPGHNSKGEEQQLDVNSPSTSNVRSMVFDGRVRFNEGTYRPSRLHSLQSSPRKKRKLELDASWKEARDLMLKADGDDEDGLSSSTFLDASRQDAAMGKGKGKAKAVDSDLPVDDFAMELYTKSQRIWRAPSADPLLELPGELVLAREGKSRTQYWPAKLLQYTKPTRQNQRPKYKVVFFDGTIRQIERDWFWTTTDDEFASCNLGESTGNYGLDRDNDALDDIDGLKDLDRPFAPEDDEILRAPSPLPALPAPEAEIFEYELSIAEQFEYVKPILAAVIENIYKPSNPRNEGFMRGGGARKRVLDAVPLRGSLSARDKEQIAFLVRSWARRRERRREMGLSVEYSQDKLHPVRHALAVLTSEGSLPSGYGDDADSVLTPTSDHSVGDPELLAPSEADAPPSSFVPTEAGTDDEKEASVQLDVPKREMVAGVPSENAIDTSPAKADIPKVSEIEKAEAMITEGGGAGTDGAVPPPLRMSFHDLDAVEKITYCNNVLLQEAILQLLLWRTGQRKTLGLLSPEEEQRLHDIAMEEGEKTNWVHDIIRMRQALGNAMLPSAQKGKADEGTAGTGTRGRTRRGA